MSLPVSLSISGCSRLTPVHIPHSLLVLYIFAIYDPYISTLYPLICSLLRVLRFLAASQLDDEKREETCIYYILRFARRYDLSIFTWGIHELLNYACMLEVRRQTDCYEI